MYTVALIASLSLALALYCAVRTLQAYLAVRNCGFPVWISPIDQGNPFLIALGPLITRSQVFRRIVPSKLWRVLDLSIYGYEWRDHVAGRPRQSPGYVIVHGGSKIDVYIEEPELASAVLGRRKDFSMDPLAMQFLGFVGPNLSSTEGEDWQRQRRLIAPMLNERIMDTVWTESCEQANDMMRHFVGQGGETDGTVEGVRRIAFNILTCIGYGQPQKWNEVKKDVPPGHKLVYMDALHRLIEGFILLALTPSTKLMQLPIMPASIRGYADALDEFRIYTRDLLQEEAQMAHISDKPRNSFLSLLATNSDKMSGKVEPAQGEKQTLSEAEIVGNLYQFTLAGWDTTANTLAYAVTMLAVNPIWQDWIMEEIDQVSQQLKGTDMGYTDVFANLPRCMALMYETLRVFTPVAHVVRECAHGQSITSGSQTYQIPPGSRVTVLFAGIHSQEEIWGPDVADFRPARWPMPEGGSAEEASTVPSQAQNHKTPSLTLQSPVKGAFLPWSGGPRICPGMKMAQVEFLAVIFTLFSNYRVDALPKDGESQDEARERLRAVTEDSAPRLTLQMNYPKKAILKWSARTAD